MSTLLAVALPALLAALAVTLGALVKAIPVGTPLYRGLTVFLGLTPAVDLSRPRGATRDLRDVLLGRVPGGLVPVPRPRQWTRNGLTATAVALSVAMVAVFTTTVLTATRLGPAPDNPVPPTAPHVPGATPTSSTATPTPTPNSGSGSGPNSGSGSGPNSGSGSGSGSGPNPGLGDLFPDPPDQVPPDTNGDPHWK